MSRLALLLVLAAGLIAPAQAEVIARATQGGLVVSLTDEKCTLAAVTNLPFRATWLEKGELTEGCYAVAEGAQVVAYFADKTVALMPGRDFRPMRSS